MNDEKQQSPIEGLDSAIWNGIASDIQEFATSVQENKKKIEEAEQAKMQATLTEDNDVDYDSDNPMSESNYSDYNETEIENLDDTISSEDDNAISAEEVNDLDNMF